MKVPLKLIPQNLVVIDKLIFAQMDSKFLHFHEYRGLSLHLQNPCIRSYPKTIQCNYTNCMCVSYITFSSSV